MKRLLLALTLLLLPTATWAQCNGVFPANTICGKLTAPGIPGPVPNSALTGVPGGSNPQIQYNNAGAFGGLTDAQVGARLVAGSSGQIQYNNSGAFGGFTASGDATIVPSTGVVTLNTVSTAKGGTGATNATNTANDVLASNGANGNFVHTAITTLLNIVCGLSPNTCGTIFGYLNASWYLAGTTCDGTTDQYTHLQAFITQIAANGAANTGPIIGYFPPGNCFISGGTLTLTMNSSTLAQNYHLIGYGTTITPDPTKVLDAFDVVRGTFITHGDESRTATIEGLTVSARNNANAPWGFNVADTRLYLVRVNCFAGDDGTTHNQGNFACYYWHQITATDPNTGAFYGKLEMSVCKGTGTGSSGVPICLRIDGSGGNAMVVSQNNFTQGGYAIRQFNPCVTVNANCAYMPNNVIIQNNNIEAFSGTCVDYHTSVPTISTLVGGVVSGNTLESCGVGVDISTFTQASGTEAKLAVGPNTLIGTATYISNANSIAIKTF